MDVNKGCVLNSCKAMHVAVRWTGPVRWICTLEVCTDLLPSKAYSGIMDLYSPALLFSCATKPWYSAVLWAPTFSDCTMSSGWPRRTALYFANMSPATQYTQWAGRYSGLSMKTWNSSRTQGTVSLTVSIWKSKCHHAFDSWQFIARHEHRKEEHWYPKSDMLKQASLVRESARIITAWQINKPNPDENVKHPGRPFSKDTAAWTEQNVSQLVHNCGAMISSSSAWTERVSCLCIPSVRWSPPLWALLT